MGAAAAQTALYATPHARPAPPPLLAAMAARLPPPPPFLPAPPFGRGGGGGAASGPVESAFAAAAALPPPGRSEESRLSSMTSAASLRPHQPPLPVFAAAPSGPNDFEAFLKQPSGTAGAGSSRVASARPPTR
jgi:hypothetical protein